MRLLITGGAGFIGSNFIRLMLSRYPENKIINFDKLTYAGNLDNLRDIEDNPDYSFVKADICDSTAINQVMKDIDIVVHFAAESHVDKSIENPEIFTKTNVLGTHVLLEAARKYDLKKFILISTDEVYGSTKKGFFHEDSPLNPNSPYSASKAAADLLGQAYFTTYNLPVIITRSSNNFGPYQFPEKVIPLFITNLIEGKKVPLYGSGLNVRDWVYVLDNCEAIDAVIHNGQPGEIYNIGGGFALPNIELTRRMLKEMEKDESWIEYVRDRLGHDFRYSLNCNKIHGLGWKPKLDFEKALKQTIKWYKENPEWWKKLKK